MACFDTTKPAVQSPSSSLKTVVQRSAMRSSGACSIRSTGCSSLPSPECTRIFWSSFPAFCRRSAESSAFAKRSLPAQFGKRSLVGSGRSGGSISGSRTVLTSWKLIVTSETSRVRRRGCGRFDLTISRCEFDQAGCEASAAPDPRCATGSGAALRSAPGLSEITHRIPTYSLPLPLPPVGRGSAAPGAPAPWRCKRRWTIVHVARRSASSAPRNAWQ